MHNGCGRPPVDRVPDLGERGDGRSEVDDHRQPVLLRKPDEPGEDIFLRVERRLGPLGVESDLAYRNDHRIRGDVAVDLEVVGARVGLGDLPRVQSDARLDVAQRPGEFDALLRAICVDAGRQHGADAGLLPFGEQLSRPIAELVDVRVAVGQALHFSRSQRDHARV